MNINELKEKVLKAEEAVIKAVKTIERHKVQAAKKLKVITDHGWNPEDRYCMKDTAEWHESYWAICEYSNKLDDIKRATYKLEEKQQILQNWKNRLEAAEQKEQKFMKEVPECMKIMMEQLIIRWDENDLERKAFLKSKCDELGWDAFIKQYSYAAYKFFRYETEEAIHKANVRSAESYVMDLYSRINVITGKVTEWDHIYCNGVALNGYVKGDLGAVNVETILAGGYNIQRLHCRTLVHEVR